MKMRWISIPKSVFKACLKKIILKTELKLTHLTTNRVEIDPLEFSTFPKRNDGLP